MNYNASAISMLKLLITTLTLSTLLVPVLNDLVSTLFIGFLQHGQYVKETK